MYYLDMDGESYHIPQLSSVDLKHITLGEESNHISWNDHVHSLIVSAHAEIAAVPFEDEQQTTGICSIHTYIHIYIHTCM